MHYHHHQHHQHQNQHQHQDQHQHHQEMLTCPARRSLPADGTPPCKVGFIGTISKYKKVFKYKKI